MYLSILRLWNFRKYAGADNKPGLEIHFQKGVNVLIGENDSGKTAIVDAIRYVLRTQSGEFIQFEDKDFYQDSDGNRKDEFISCYSAKSAVLAISRTITPSSNTS